MDTYSNQLTKENARAFIKSLSKMDLEAVGQAFAQGIDFAKKIVDAFNIYIKSSDESRNQVHEHVKKVLVILEKVIDKSDKPSEQLQNDVIQVAKELVEKEADVILDQEHAKQWAGWIVGGICVLALVIGFFGGGPNNKSA